MTVNFKLLGGVLLYIGTTIGAGLLALPLATAQLGFFGSVILLIGFCAILTLCGFLFLEVHLWFPRGSNLITMTGATLGWPAQVIAWISYLIFLYSLISAYISGGGDLFHYVFLSSGISIPTQLASLIFTLLFGIVVYCGIHSVDYINRGLMFGKMGTFIWLIILLTPFVTMANLTNGDLNYFFHPNCLTVVAVAFGSLMIIPSLHSYFGDDVTSVRKVIFFGSLIPLICYIAWNMVIMGIIPVNGSKGLENILHSSNSNSQLVITLTFLVQQNIIALFVKFFTSICMVTSFLTISLSLSDFISDGLHLSKRGIESIIVYSATFLPPLIAVLFFQDAFIRGLNYAGLCCFILMMLFPPLMVWRGRYHLSLSNGTDQVPGGKFVLLPLIIFAILMIVIWIAM